MDLIAPDMEPVLYKYIRSKCEENQCWLEAIGGTSDHVHILVRFITSMSIGKLVHQIKGASSHYIAQIHRPDDFFKWQGGYSAFTVSPFQVKSISKYIENQKQHHCDRTFRLRWEQENP
jgi:REP element-mobilizing transposase RayT